MVRVIGDVLGPEEREVGPQQSSTKCKGDMEELETTLSQEQEDREMCAKNRI